MLVSLHRVTSSFNTSELLEHTTKKWGIGKKSRVSKMSAQVCNNTNNYKNNNTITKIIIQ